MPVANASAFALKESAIQRTCTDFLVAEGWRPLRTDPVSESGSLGKLRGMLMSIGALTPFLPVILDAIKKCTRGKGFGEEGMPDHLFIRYGFIQTDPGPGASGDFWGNTRAISEVLWVEWKRIDGRGRTTKPRPGQRDWHTQERAKGALTVILGVDCEASIEGFIRHYHDMGLRRRRC